MKARTAALNTLVQTVVTAPESLHTRLAGLRGAKLVQAAAALGPSSDLGDPAQATKLALRRLAQRCHHLDAEIAAANADLHTLIAATAPGLLDQYGVGVDVDGQLLVTAGDNPDRMHSEASFAALFGTSPVPVSSGRTDRHRLNRGADRHANSALYTVALVRMSHHPATRDHVTPSRTQGRTTKETIGCLKRHVARELPPHIRQALTPQPTLDGLYERQLRVPAWLFSLARGPPNRHIRSTPRAGTLPNHPRR